MSKTVLLADSDLTSLELMAAVLTREGFQVLATPDGGDALARFFEASPGIVVCACELPGVSGRELCRQIKAASSDTRVVLLKAGADVADVEAAASEAGCDAILPSPFRYPDLKSLLITWGLLASESSHSSAGSEKVFYGVPAPQPAPLQAPQPPTFDAPQAVAPPTFDKQQVSPPSDQAAAAPTAPAPAAAAPADRLAGPPLLTPIPLPMPSQAPQIDDDIPELDLGAIGVEEELPAAEIVIEDTVSDETPAALAAAASVSAPATKIGGLAIPTEGELAETPLPRLIYELYHATFTGVVHLVHDAVSRSIYLRAGLPVRVDSHQMSEMLGRLLVEHGRITLEQYTQSLQYMQENECRQGEALVHLGALRESELLDALRDQTEIKLVNAFAWREGNYYLDPDESFQEDTVICEVAPLKAIWRGVHEHYDIESLLAYFAPMSTRYAVATGLFKVHYETLGPFLRDLDIVSLLDGQTTFEAALNRGERTLRVAQALYVLFVTDMIKAAEQPSSGAVAPEPTMSASAPASKLASASAPAMGADALARLSDEIAADYMRIKDSDYFDAMRVDPTSTAEEVDFAFSNQMRGLRLDDLPAGLSDDVVRRAREMRDILEKAHMILRDPMLRDRYMMEQQASFGPGTEAAAPEAEVPVPGQIASLEVDLDGGRQASIVAERHFLDGQGMMRNKNYAEAGKRFQDAVAANPREPGYRVALGKVIMAIEGIENAGSRTKVVTCLQQALQLDPAHQDANLEMANLLVASKHKDRAYAYVQRVLQRTPDHPEARKILASLG
ncbi:MAG: response regulator [Myxococcota bacterium]